VSRFVRLLHRHREAFCPQHDRRILGRYLEPHRQHGALSKLGQRELDIHGAGASGRCRQLHKRSRIGQRRPHVLANARQQEWQRAEAEAAHRRAIALNPSDSIAHLGLAAFLAARGCAEDAVAIAGRAREFDPLSLQTRSAMGVQLYFARRYEEAISQFRSVQEMEPNHLWSLWHLGLALLETSRLNEAIEALERTVAASERSATPLGSLAMAYGRAGRDADAQRNGRRSRLSVSWVGLWRGLIARSTFGLAIRTFAANSFTPMARTTFPRAT
jgi:tetratricopeptide (TPR) repeat protein